MGACAQQGGQRGAECVGGVVGGVAGGWGGVVAGGGGVRCGRGRGEMLGGGGGHRGQRRQLRRIDRGQRRPLASVLLEQTWDTAIIITLLADICLPLTWTARMG